MWGIPAEGTSGRLLCPDGRPDQGGRLPSEGNGGSRFANLPYARRQLAPETLGPLLDSAATVTVHSPRARDRRSTRSVPLEQPVDNEQRHHHNGDTRRMFGRALWLKDNLPITPDEWALLNLLIFGDVPVKRPTSAEFERARARHTSLRGLVALPIGDPRVERAPDRGVLEASPMLSRTTGPRPSG